MGAMAGVFTGFNQAGKSYVDFTGDHRYARTTWSELENAGVAFDMSSVRVFSGQGAPALILFSGQTISPLPEDFAGEFMQFTNASDVTFNQNLDGTLAEFNNAATSMLVVRTQLAPETKLSFKTLFTPAWDKFLDGNLPSDVERVGEPAVGWVAFSSYGNLDPDKIYIRIDQQLNVVMDWWSDYEAWITYFVKLSASGGGIVAGVKRWEYWVEGGLFSDAVAAELEPNVASGATTLANALNTAFAPFSSVTDLYLLPGNQTTKVAEGNHDVHWDDARNDVTLVIQT